MRLIVIQASPAEFILLIKLMVESIERKFATMRPFPEVRFQPTAGTQSIRGSELKRIFAPSAACLADSIRSSA